MWNNKISNIKKISALDGRKLVDSPKFYPKIMALILDFAIKWIILN